MTLSNRDVPAGPFPEVACPHCAVKPFGFVTVSLEAQPRKYTDSPSLHKVKKSGAFDWDHRAVVPASPIQPGDSIETLHRKMLRFSEVHQRQPSGRSSGRVSPLDTNADAMMLPAFTQSAALVYDIEEQQGAVGSQAPSANPSAQTSPSFLVEYPTDDPNAHTGEGDAKISGDGGANAQLHGGTGREVGPETPRVHMVGPAADQSTTGIVMLTPEANISITSIATTEGKQIEDLYRATADTPTALSPLADDGELGGLAEVHPPAFGEDSTSTIGLSAAVVMLPQ